MLGVVVPTVGRWEALECLLDSLDRAAATNAIEVEVVIVVQGTTATPAPDGATHPNLRVTVVQDPDGWGASRARNIGMSHLSDHVTHAIWPNDHSFYPAESIAALEQHLDQADVIVGRLVEDGTDRYRVTSSDDPLTLTNVWDAIEPATAIAVHLVRSRGGWVETLGTGASSPWQSSALADLLLQVADDAEVIWEPAFAAQGAGFVRGAAGKDLRAKVRSYGRGYGRVLSRWHYPWRRRVGSVMKPLVQPGYRVGPDVLPASARIATAVGRAEGIVGHLVPSSSSGLRSRASVRKH